MESYRKWFYRALGILAATVGLIGLFNYTVDPYGLLRKDFSYQFVEPNKNFIKIRFIAQNPNRYDGFVFGSSRVNGIDVRKIRGYACYNVHYSGGLPRDHLDNIRFLLKKGVKIKLILIGLDEFSFKDDPDARLYQPLRHPYPPVLGQHPLGYYLGHYFSLPDGEILRAVVNGYKKRLFNKSEDDPPFYYDIFNTGQMFFDRLDRQIDDNPEKHRNDPKFLKHLNLAGDHLNEALADLKEIVRLAGVHQVRLVLFINPLHKNVFLDSGEDFDRFKRKLSHLSGFYDFSGLNSVTRDNVNYYETSHYRRKVGDLMIARIFNDRNSNVPEDFGQWVTRETIDLHLKILRQQANRYVISKAPAVEIPQKNSWGLAQSTL
jgi:hypothetical protein